MLSSGLSSNITDTDPFYSVLGNKAGMAKPLDNSPEAGFTAAALNKFLSRAACILTSHPLNKERQKKALSPANYILCRGASSIQTFPRFQEKYGLRACCIAGRLLYQQIAKTLGMDLIKVKGATGLANTHLKAKFLAAKKALKKYDFVFQHIKATDSLAEDGNFEGKKHFIEKIDKSLRFVFEQHNKQSIVSFFAKNVANKDFVWAVTSDHSTCSNLKRHCKAPIPFLISNSQKDTVSQFSESACSKGSLTRFSQLNVMQILINAAN